MSKFFSFLTVALCTSFMLCAAELTEVFRIDSSSDDYEAVNIIKKDGGFDFNAASSWQQPISFNPANAELELNARLDLVPVNPAKKRTYSHLWHFSDVNKKTVASLLLVRYPDVPGQALINFTAFDSSGKMLVCQRRTAVTEKGGNHIFTIRMTPDKITLFLDGKRLTATRHNSTFNSPATVSLGKHNGPEPAARMNMKKFTVRSI